MVEHTTLTYLGGMLCIGVVSLVIIEFVDLLAQESQPHQPDGT